MSQGVSARPRRRPWWIGGGQPEVVAWNLNKLAWHRLLLFANYTLSSSRTNTSGAFSIPANDDNLEAEWGPSSGDARHRLGGMVNAQPVTNLTVSFNVSYRSALPYHITTGHNDNGDGVFNDRPAGRRVTRRAARPRSIWAGGSPLCGDSPG
jgi:hypothetical protein